MKMHNVTLSWWAKLLLLLPTVVLVQWGVVKLGGMFAGLATSESGAPVPLQQYPMALMAAAACSLLLVAVLFCAYADRQPLSALGLHLAGFEKQGLMGLLAALALLSATLSIIQLIYSAQFESGTATGSDVFGWLILMLLVAVCEEVLFRGYIQRNLQHSLPRWLALVITSALFSLMHAGNPGQHWLTLPGIFIGGLLLGINYLYTGNLWFGIGLHFGWNALLGPVLGLQVSGIKPAAFIHTQLKGPAWLTGGNFGPEGSVVYMALSLGLLTWLWRSFAPAQQHS